ncbi:2-nitropropane dioxygenase [Spinellus fusiger]|nr:2-nitropropane dioxygenase [Spinellus fusiger]
MTMVRLRVDETGYISSTIELHLPCSSAAFHFAILAYKNPPTSTVSGDVYFSRALKLRFPIVQAPCAGHSNAKLTAAVSNAGGLGSIGAGNMGLEDLRAMIRETKALTDHPFAVNLFCISSPRPTQEDLQQEYPSDTVLNAIRHTLKLPLPTSFSLKTPVLEHQATIIIEEDVRVVSFTFGCLPEPILHAFRKANIFLIGTATNVEEALALSGHDGKEPQADCIVAQGSEAGGHRGSFLYQNQNQDMPTEDLVKAIRAKAPSSFSQPVLAAGGISDGLTAGKALTSWGADGVVCGTLFMLATESATPESHKQAILRGSSTDMTRAMTGHPPSHRIQSTKNADILSYATRNNITDYMLLLSTQKTKEVAVYSEQGTLTAAQIIEKLAKDVL